MRLNLIYARARNGVIGRDNALPWHIPEDLAHFKQLTLGAPVLMGRRTWESLPERFRPLPGRLNLVLTRQTGWSAPGAQVCPSLEAALSHCRRLPEPPAEVWVIGGATLYREALPLAQRIELTEIGADFEGDAVAPTLGSEWAETARLPMASKAGHDIAFVTLERVNSP